MTERIAHDCIWAVGAVLAEVAEREVLTRRPSRVSAPQHPGRSRQEIVTEADLRAEAAIAPRLRALADLPVVGEESAKTDARLRSLTAQPESYWLLDPIDGTSNFAAGSDAFGLMACLVLDGTPTLAVIHLPTSGRTVHAERGCGAYDGARRLGTSRADRSEALRGSIYRGFFDEPTQVALAAAERDLSAPDVPKPYAAAVDYVAVAEGAKDFLVYGRVRPWDHAPGCLIVREAGGIAALARGASPYTPAIEFGPLVVAGTISTFDRVAARVSEAVNAPRAVRSKPAR